MGPWVSHQVRISRSWRSRLSRSSSAAWAPPPRGDLRGWPQTRTTGQVLRSSAAIRLLQAGAWAPAAWFGDRRRTGGGGPGRWSGWVVTGGVQQDAPELLGETLPAGW